MYKKIALLTLAILLLGLPTGALAYGGWLDRFDAYPTGSQMHGVGGWKGWDNNPSFGALTSDVQARSSPNSVDIVGAADLVHEFTGYTSGFWTFTAWQYIPGNFTGTSYFMLLNTYFDSGPYNWSTQVQFDGASGLVISDSSGATSPLITDQWVELRVEIDLDANMQTFYYNGQMLHNVNWTEGISGGGAVNIGAVDLFANGATSVFYDDMSLLAPPTLVSLTSLGATGSGSPVAITLIALAVLVTISAVGIVVLRKRTV